MLGSFFILGQIEDVRDLLDQPPGVGGGFDSTDTLIILGFIFLLAVALFSWAYFIRKRPNERSGGRVLTRPPRRRRRHSEEDDSANSSFRRERVRRRRRRSEDHMRRNPTLEETGGLPPPRSDDSEDAGGSDSDRSAQPHV
jgi:hypothetical protein